MRYCLVLLPLLAAGCADTYDNGYAYRGDAYYGRYHAPGYGNGYAYRGEYNDPRYPARDYTAPYGGDYYASRELGLTVEKTVARPMNRELAHRCRADRSKIIQVIAGRR